MTSVLSGTCRTVAMSGLIVLAATVPKQVAAVACPGAGAAIEIYVENRTNSAVDVTLHGQVVASTCTNKQANYNQACTNVPAQSWKLCTVTGLNSGSWRHHISYPLGSITVTQAQLGVVLADASAKKRLDWSYHSHRIVVDAAGDAGTGSCPVNAAPSGTCDIRSAVTTANGLTPTLYRPVLIQFTQSPGTLSGSHLVLTRQDLTLDGTSSTGSPWIVADPSMAAAGKQSTFPAKIQLAMNTGIEIRNSRIELRGLDIKQTVSTEIGATKSVVEVFSGGLDFRLVNSRVDGGMDQDCAIFPNNCTHFADVVPILDRTGPVPFGAQSAELANVELRSGIDSGLKLGVYTTAKVFDSWLHNNYRRNIAIKDSNVLIIDRSVVERAGLRAQDDLAVGVNGAGVEVENLDAVEGPSASILASMRSIYRNNAGAGVTAIGAKSFLLPANDAFCGNGLDGIHTEEDVTATGYPVVSSSGGIGAIYNGNAVAPTNRRHGVNVHPAIATSIVLEHDSVFASNTECGLFNRNATNSVWARFNQWRGSSPFVDTCVSNGGGPVDSSSPVDPFDTTAFQVLGALPADRILADETIQIEGFAFNAIVGNPLSSEASCANGIDGSGEWSGTGTPQAASCCRSIGRSNTCPADPNDPVVGNCVRIVDANSNVRNLEVGTVTPRIIEAVLPANIICRGNSGERVNVIKSNSSGMPVLRDAPYCVPL